jgi:hypothetical protein
MRNTSRPLASLSIARLVCSESCVPSAPNVRISFSYKCRRCFRTVPKFFAHKDDIGYVHPRSKYPAVAPFSQQTYLWRGMLFVNFPYLSPTSSSSEAGSSIILPSLRRLAVSYLPHSSHSDSVYLIRHLHLPNLSYLEITGNYYSLASAIKDSLSFAD